jgi:LPPG:FO 2-phospho-L-lactate transferase
MIASTEARPVAERIAVLCGGLGGSRLVHALSLVADDPASIAAIGNVGDDIEFLGLRVSPDLDTVLYTLAGLLDEERGWGVRDETYGALSMAGLLGEETWFTLGDRDIGLHLARTRRLLAGEPLSSVTSGLAASLGVSVRILPATDDPLRTVVLTDAGPLPFQTWFVRRRHEDEVRGFRFEGAEEARPAPGVLEALVTADAVVIAPSNPFVSIAPILAVPGIVEALHDCRGRKVAVSPLVGGRAFRGPLASMMRTLGYRSDAAGIAQIYAGLVDTLVVDRTDATLAREVEALGVGVALCDTVMVEPSRRPDIGRQLLEEVLA